MRHRTAAPTLLFVGSIEQHTGQSTTCYLADGGHVRVLHWIGRSDHSYHRKVIRRKYLIHRKDFLEYGLHFIKALTVELYVIKIIKNYLI